MMALKKEKQYWLLALLVLGTCGCQSRARTTTNPPDSGAMPEAAAASTPRPAQALQLDEPMMANIKVEALSQSSMPMLLTATGKVQFNEERIARVLAPVSGPVLNLKVKVGDPVRKGGVLFFINSREVAAAISEHLESHKDLDLAEKTYAMTKDLFEHGATPRISLQQAENDLAKATARVARTEEVLRVLGEDLHEEGPSRGSADPRVPVRAPLSGTIIERSVTEGQFVQPDSNALLTIADLSTVWVLADVFERDLHLVSVGQTAEVTTAAYPEQRFVAHVSHINDVVDPTTRTVKVRFLVSNPGARLKPEMFASATLFLNQSARGLTVPAKAVFTEGGRNFVYVGVGERQFVRRPVEVSPDGSGRLRVSQGLKPGEKIVSDGALLLRQQEMKESATANGR
jgi:cobalt-zinc-cadmium efflux system membrane fusion protein